MKGYSYIPDVDVTNQLKKDEILKLDQELQDRNYLEIVGPDEI